jgi:hypothetical protein
MVRQMPGCAGVAASPTKQLLVYGDRGSPDTPFALFTISLDDLQPHQLTFPADKVVGDQDPVFSPDGESVAFMRIIGEATADIYVVPLAGGTSRQLTFDRTFVNGITWTAEGRSIVFSSHRGGGQSLWVVPVAGGEAARLPLGGATASHPAISSRGDRLAYTQGDLHPNLWVIELSDRWEESTRYAPTQVNWTSSAIPFLRDIQQQPPVLASANGWPSLRLARAKWRFGLATPRTAPTRNT